MLSAKRSGPPCVTGISPKEGPPGTRVTIRGENLGIDPRDLIGLRICTGDCLLSAEWKSPNKLVARTGQAKGKGEIIVVTRSGGVGSCTVTFRGYKIQIGPLQDSAVWIDETQTYHAMFSRNRASSPIASDDHDDPLGISDESNESRFPENKLNEMFPEGSGNTSLDNFEPAWYLLENHHGTSFDDLKAGLAFLKRKSSQHNEGPMTFVKSNLTTFLDCFDTLTEMHKRIKEDQASGTTITENLESTLHNSNKAAVALFHDVLGRKDRADATRNALGVLQRFKFLFNLPCTMERNIKKGDYDLVITDYTRAKSLFGDTDVQVFKKVYQEVENRIKAFRDTLYTKLMELPSSVDEQKKLIRFLVHLEAPGDPAWDCLVNMQKWLVQVLHRCKEEQIHKEEQAEKERQERGSPLSPLSPTLTTSRSQNFKAKGPQKIAFVDVLTKILCESLPDLWRLGQSYFSGKLLKGVKKVSRGPAANQPQFRQMVLDVVLLYSNLVRAAFLSDSLNKYDKVTRLSFGVWPIKKQVTDSPIGWLPLCVRHSRACHSALCGIDLPPEAMEILQQLTFDLRCNCISTLLKQAVQDIKNLHSRESWIVDTDDERGGTTLLPALFESIVSETVQHLNEIVIAKPGETELFESLEMSREATELSITLLQSFAGTLEQLAIIGNVERENRNRRTAISPDQYYGQSGDSIPTLDKRLIIMMSNCNQTAQHVLPRLIETLQRHRYPNTEKVSQGAQWCYRSLDTKLFDNYIEEKVNPVIGALEQNMYAGNFDWARCPPPKGVSNSVKMAVTGIIGIHAEVYSISPHFVGRVMRQVIEAVVDEFSRLVQCVPSFGREGGLQARLDVGAFEVTVAAYSTQETREALREARECLPPLADPQDKRRLDELIAAYKNRMKFHMMCFVPDKQRKG